MKFSSNGVWALLYGCRLRKQQQNCCYCFEARRYCEAKVKEPLAAEYGFCEDLYFTYLHMAAAPELADAMVNAKTTGVAYEQRA